MSRDPLDLTLREVMAICDASVDQSVDTEAIAKEFGKPGRLVVQDALGHMHPANAGQLLRDLEQALDSDNGLLTGQGSYHPDFQRSVESIRKDPNDRFNDQ